MAKMRQMRVTKVCFTLENAIKEPALITLEIELLYDPVLECYFDPKTNKYYQLK